MSAAVYATLVRPLRRHPCHLTLPEVRPTATRVATAAVRVPAPALRVPAIDMTWTAVDRLLAVVALWLAEGPGRRRRGRDAVRRRGTWYQPTAGRTVLTGGGQ